MGRAVNTVCHASKRLFLRKCLNKTQYELLTENEPNVKYFRVFNCKCDILNKKTQLVKFQSKTTEGILVGYGSNSHTYRIFNRFNGCVEETCNVVFDKFNGSHGKQVNLSYVGDEHPSYDIMAMGIGGIFPMQQGHINDEETSSTILVFTPL